ncbi:MAG TPA: phytanoyl-CoA dioxygenase family protein [Blastocatellia bacterium]|jgi:Protein involved in biosynthesis of mitomycin antibiotics/polyketide fumonisin
MTNTLSNRQLTEYEHQGIVFPIKALSSEEAAYFNSEFKALIKRCGLRRRLDNLHLFFEWAYRLVTHDAVLDAVQDVLGEDILVYGSLVFYKPPRDSGYVSWHQDSLYSGLHLTPSISAWIALTQSNSANGCMRVIPKSHKHGLLNHTNAVDEANLIARGEQVATVINEAEALDVVLQPGEMSLHHSTIVHGSMPNTSNGPRIGFIVRFVTDQIMNRAWPMLRVRGKADCSHLILAEPLLETDPYTAFEAWHKFSAAQSGG